MQRDAVQRRRRGEEEDEEKNMKKRDGCERRGPMKKMKNNKNKKEGMQLLEGVRFNAILVKEIDGQDKIG